MVEVPQRSLRGLLDEYGFEEVDILKMDIEGSEYDLLEGDPLIFLRFRNIYAEIHGVEAKRGAFVSGLSDLGFVISHKSASVSCETVFARRALDVTGGGASHAATLHGTGPHAL